MLMKFLRNNNNNNNNIHSNHGAGTRRPLPFGLHLEKKKKLWKRRNDDALTAACSVTSYDDVTAEFLIVATTSPPPPPPPPLHHHPLKRRSSRTVTFAPASDNTIHCSCIRALSKEEKKNYWYTRDDYDQFTASWKALAEEFRRMDCFNKDPQSFPTMLTRALKACEKTKKSEFFASSRSRLLGRQDEAALQQWLDQGSRCGMERTSVPAIWDKEERRRQVLYAAIRTAQTKGKHGLSPETRSEYLCQVSQRITLASRLFAWRLAQ